MLIIFLQEEFMMMCVELVLTVEFVPVEALAIVMCMEFLLPVGLLLSCQGGTCIERWTW